MKIEIDKPVVPQWFDEWYRSMKYAGDRETFILKVMFSVNHYGRYDDYRRDNGFFDKDQFTYISDNFMKVINAIQFGYEVEQESLYYAKVKGWELASSRSAFWNYHLIIESPMLPRLYTGDKEDKVYIKTKMTIEDWNKRGINETNADFEEVE